MPSLIRFVRSAAAAMKISGEAMISLPAEWCSPIHASSIPERVEVLDELEVALQRQGRVLTCSVERGQERAESQPAHASSSTSILG